MPEYDWISWLFFFIIYCMVGWCFETAYVSIRQKRYVNRGFMRGPYLPIYGFGAIVMLISTIPVRNNLLLSFLFGMIAATILEYVTGVLMEMLFKVRYWDYSCKKFNFQGHICLTSSLAWGGMTLLLNEILHKPVEKLCFMIPEKTRTVVTLIVFSVMLVDFGFAMKNAFAFRFLLDRIENAKRELANMQKRLDVVVAFSVDSFEKKKEETERRIEELMEKQKRNFRRILRNHPSMRSFRFNEAWENIKSFTEKLLK